MDRCVVKMADKLIWEGIKSKTLLGRKATPTYDKMVVPLGQFEMINISQKYHKKAQKQLKKAIRCLAKARAFVECMPLAKNKGSDMITKQIYNVRDLSEKLKKYYFDRLPYVDLEDIKGSEE